MCHILEKTASGCKSLSVLANPRSEQQCSRSGQLQLAPFHVRCAGQKAVQIVDGKVQSLRTKPVFLDDFHQPVHQDDPHAVCDLWMVLQVIWIWPEPRLTLEKKAGRHEGFAGNNNGFIFSNTRAEILSSGRFSLHSFSSVGECPLYNQRFVAPSPTSGIHQTPRKCPGTNL